MRILDKEFKYEEMKKYNSFKKSRLFYYVGISLLRFQFMSICISIL